MTLINSALQPLWFCDGDVPSVAFFFNYRRWQLGCCPKSQHQIACLFQSSRALGGAAIITIRCKSASAALKVLVSSCCQSAPLSSMRLTSLHLNPASPALIKTNLMHCSPSHHLICSKMQCLIHQEIRPSPHRLLRFQLLIAR
jgi:hypothetical protein